MQQRWHPDPDEHEAALAAGIKLAAGEGARLVCLQELTLSRYFAVDPGRPGGRGRRARGAARRPDPPLRRPDGGGNRRPRPRLALRARRRRATGSASTPRSSSPPTASCVARTRKLHIPVTAGYHEDRYFRPGPAGADAFPVLALGEAQLGLPTCWDQWFPEVARAYSLAGAEVLVYPTAIGSEPDHPEFDTEPLWQRVIVANGIANGTFMVAVNRIGNEPPLSFYGSSFISDPYGRVLAQAPRDEPAVLVADLDLDQRRDWLELFPFLAHPPPRRLLGADRLAPLGRRQRRDRLAELVRRHDRGQDRQRDAAGDEGREPLLHLLRGAEDEHLLDQLPGRRRRGRLAVAGLPGGDHRSICSP